MWWKHFLALLAGGLPLILLLGGALAVYLGFEETKDKFFKKPETPAYEPPKMAEAEVEKYKAEVDRLKSEIEDLKNSSNAQPGFRPPVPHWSRGLSPRKSPGPFPHWRCAGARPRLELRPGPGRRFPGVPGAP